MRFVQQVKGSKHRLTFAPTGEGKYMLSPWASLLAPAVLKLEPGVVLVSVVKPGVSPAFPDHTKVYTVSTMDTPLEVE